MTKVDFYCKNCMVDQTLPAVKRSIEQYGSEWWEAPCESCNKRLIRRITERNLDPYLWESVKLKKERDKYAVDLIQKNDPKFKVHYKDIWDADQEIEERAEKQERESVKSRDKFYKEFSTNSVTKRFAKETIKRGEELSNKPYGR